MFETELVYGTILRLPETNFESTNIDDQCEYLKKTPKTFKNILATPTNTHTRNSILKLPQSVIDAQFIFISSDAHRSPFQKNHDGPFKVLERKEKYFVVMNKGQMEQRCLSVDLNRLKSAIMSKDTSLSKD